MSYKLVLYRTTTDLKSAPVIDHINKVFNEDIIDHSWGALEDYHLVAFDVEVIKEKIINALGDKCRIYIREAPPYDGKVQYIEIFTNYENAVEVFISIQQISEVNDLVLYDKTTKKCYFKETDDIKSICETRIRSSQIKVAINKEFKGLKAIRKVNEYFCEDNKQHEEDYVVTIKKIKEISFEERTVLFYECLLRNKLESEELYCSDNCFNMDRDYSSPTIPPKRKQTFFSGRSARWICSLNAGR